jgi:transposase
MNILRQVVGIDVAQKELVVTLGRKFDDLSEELYAYQVFKNSKTGFNSLISWVEKLTDESVNTSFVMEATGVYHQKFAYYLDDKNLEINIVLPNKISNYIKTLDIKTINDKRKRANS